ncbi:MAG: flagellar basal body rod protein FlgC [candidate division Zixibacteria bacterium]|nr:flagellar basal body rod protein FlgC [candidate division Zixibacteria bacterium]
MAGILNAIEISSRGLSIQRARMNVVAENIANAETTETVEGGPYRRKRIVVSEGKTEGTFDSMIKQATGRLTRTDSRHLSTQSRPSSRKVDLPSVDWAETVDPDSGFRIVHDPSHPEADADGYVKMPDVEIVNEMVDMIAASRAYEANTSAISAAKKMAQDALDI